MKWQVKSAILTSLIFALQMASARSPELKIACKLSPAGNFVAETSAVKGSVIKNADGSVTAKDVTVDVNSLKTGIELRDKHLKKRLLSDKYPQAKLVTADGKDGKGTATLEVKGLKKPVEGTYKIEEGFLVADFKMSLAALEINDARYMGVGVKDEVAVTVAVPIRAAEAPAAPAAKKKK